MKCEKNCAAGQGNFRRTIEEYAAGAIYRPRISYFGLTEPLLEFPLGRRNLMERFAVRFNHDTEFLFHKNLHKAGERFPVHTIPLVG